jgi:hypothetical protein
VTILLRRHEDAHEFAVNFLEQQTFILVLSLSSIPVSKYALLTAMANTLLCNML